MTRRASIQVTGRVQGVYYRYETTQKADEFGLVGTVRNMSDGSVAIICEGEERDVLRLVEWCKCGPRGARVDKTDVEWGEPSHSFTDFSVAY
jgi:acylphosphatase